MDFPQPLQRATLVSRYKRFFADVVLEDGRFATVLTINDRMCRWPIGDPAENEFHFWRRGFPANLSNTSKTWFSSRVPHILVRKLAFVDYRYVFGDVVVGDESLL